MKAILETLRTIWALGFAVVLFAGIVLSAVVALAWPAVLSAIMLMIIV